MKDVYKIVDGFTRIVCWAAIVCTVPVAIFVLFFMVGGLFFQSKNSLESIASFVPALLWVLFIGLVLLATIYKEKIEPPTYKFWLALFVRHACAWPIVGWAVMHKEIVLKFLLVARKWYFHY